VTVQSAGPTGPVPTGPEPTGPEPTGPEPSDPGELVGVPAEGTVPDGVPPDGLPPEGLPPNDAETAPLVSSGPWIDPLALVVGLVAVGVVVAALHHPRTGMFVVSAGLGVGALLRLVLNRRHAGLLAVRSRRLDVAILVGLSAALGVLAAVTPFPPGQG
jgi:hypothetical protein